MAETAESEGEQVPESGGTDGAAEQTSAPEQAAAPEQGAGRTSHRRSRARKAEKPAEELSPAERHARRLEHRRAKALSRRTRRAQERAKEADARTGAAPAPELPAVHAAKRGAPKERQGVVVSSKADKTITVRIDVARQHRRYEKTVRSSTTLHAHDEENNAHEGDMVRVVESRPLSKTKRWRLLEVLERAR